MNVVNGSVMRGRNATMGTVTIGTVTMGSRNRCLWAAGLLLLAGGPGSVSPGGSGAVAAPPDRPNIVLMLADDQGWDGLSVAMAPDIDGSRSTLFQTPRLEAFAHQGMRFTDAYAPAPVCSPSRISIQCGRTPAALHWTKAAPPETGHRLIEPRDIRDIPAAAVTVGDVLRRAGHATAHYGKWHIGGGGPGANGYDEHDGDVGNEQAYRFTDPNPVDIFGMAERAEVFMRKARDAGQPFYVQLSWNALHAPENALEATKRKYAATDGASRQVERAAITEDLDTGVGRVLDAIDRLGLAGTTFVIYTSDNGSGGGGGGRRVGLTGGKGSVWEGGIRVPFIVRGPGVKPDSFCRVPVVGWDLFPTFCQWAGVPAEQLPAGLEGGSIATLLAQGGTGTVSRRLDGMVFHFPHYQSGHTPHAAIRVGDMKLMEFFEDGSTKLFDLSRDPGERQDLAPARPDVARDLRQRLDRYLAAVDARMPTPNRDFDPAAPPPRKQGGRRGPNGGGAKGNGKGKGAT
ncbi:MAG: sulfatase-like hydrolase/transferase [Pirellulales bacterium]